jgi:uncharacterized membrane protein
VRSASDGSPEFVPRIAVTVAFVLTLVSVVMLVFFLAHLAAQLRVETMLKEIHAETDRTLKLVSDTSATTAAFDGTVEVPARRRVVTAASSGFITDLDHGALVESAADHDIVIQVDRTVGENVVAGTPLAYWWAAGAGSGADPEEVASVVRGAFSIGYERTAAGDVDYGVQQIVDIALRALSPGVNDPTTAVHALGHLSAITARRLQAPPVPTGLAGPGGQLCVVTAAHSRAQDIDTALTPLRHYGATHPAVVARFLQAVSELHLLGDDPAVDDALLAQLDALTEQLRSGSTSDPAAIAELLLQTRELRSAIARDA